MRQRMTGPSRRMTGNVASRGVGQGTTGFARGAPFKIGIWSLFGICLPAPPSVY
jgi:hypothetical protein